MSSMSKPSVRVGIAIVRDGDSFLIGTRTAGQELEGFAEFPGGKCHEDETSQVCVVRECKEETGLVVLALHEYEIVEHEYEHAKVELHFWVCKVSESASKTAPEGNFHWVLLNELSKLKFPEANAKIVERLISEK